MELSMAEFASFNLRSKSQILSYKAHLIGCISTEKNEMQLYGMGGLYYIKYIEKVTDKVLSIEPVINPDMLLLFSTSTNVAAYFMN